jgi:hypothetical protein
MREGGKKEWFLREEMRGWINDLYATLPLSKSHSLLFLSMIDRCFEVMFQDHIHCHNLLSPSAME